jgi:hypothetical protein
MAKIGFDQIDVPAPKFYRRLVNALIIIVVPSTITLITQIPEDILSESSKMLAVLGVNYVMALLKAAEFILGQDFVKTEEDGITS